MRSALVTEAHVRSVLAGIRGLGRAGVRTVAAAPLPRSAGRTSRWARAGVAAPDAALDPEGHVAAVVAAATAHPDAIVYPGTERSLSACLDLAGDIIGPRLPYPDPSALGPLRHKPTMTLLAGRANFHTPATLYAGPASAAPSDLPTPCVLKPSRSDSDGQAVAAFTAAELTAALGELPPATEVLVQERVPGALMAVTVVLDADGALRAEFHQRAERIWPAHAGASARAVGVCADPDVTAHAIAMLRAVGFAGLAQVQYLSTPEGPVVVDVNPRYYGSMPLAMASGVNFPAVWHAAVCGLPRRPIPGFRVDVSYRWMEADIADAHGGDLSLLRPPPRPRVGSSWSVRDPLPGVVLAGEFAASRLRRRLRRA